MTKEKMALVMAVVALTAGAAMAAPIYVGTYTYSMAPTGGWGDGDLGDAGPITYNASSAQGDGQGSGVGDLRASWNNGSNQLGSTPVKADFDLGSSYPIADVTIWVNEGTYTGINGGTFRYSTNGTDYTVLGSFTRVFDTGWVTRSVDAGGVDARYIQIELNPLGWQHLTLGEVMISEVPEPATMALLLGGGALALLRRRR